MDEKNAVPFQAVLLATIALATALLVGRSGAEFTFYTLAVGTTIWIVLLGRYLFISKRDFRKERWSGDRRVGLLCLFGLIAPMLIAGGVNHGLIPGAEVLSGDPAWLAMGLLVVTATSILVSSLIDWYVINPFVFGANGSPIWELDESGPTVTRRRFYAQFWAGHRAVCETVCFSALAASLAIMLVAFGRSFESDGTISRAIESLGGAGIAFGFISFRGPGIRDAFKFMLKGPVGLGYWVTQGGASSPLFVLDVSIDPGIKLVDETGHRTFVSLGEASSLHPDNSRPQVTSKKLEEWVRRAYRKDQSDEESEREAREKAGPLA